MTARSDEVDKLLGLEIGADDYIAKPFSPREVCARVRTVLRRLQKFAAPSPVVRVGEFVLDEQAAAISWFGQPLNLTRYEFLLLKTLLHAPGRVFSRQQLMELVWIDAESLDRTVDTHIKTLRAKLRAVNPEKAPINTHRGMGYSPGAADAHRHAPAAGLFSYRRDRRVVCAVDLCPEVKPGVRRATEGTLNDTATLLAALAREDLLAANPQQGRLAQAFHQLNQQPLNANIGGIKRYVMSTASI